MAQHARIQKTGHGTTPRLTSPRAEQPEARRGSSPRPSRRSCVGAGLTTLLLGLGSSIASAQGRVMTLATSNTTVVSSWRVGASLDQEPQVARFGAVTTPLLRPALIERRFAPRPMAAGAMPATGTPYAAEFQPLVRSYQDEPAASSSSYFRAKDGVYVAGLLLRASIDDDDFDGTGGVSGGGSAEIMPTVDDGTGTGWAIGVRKGNSSMEFNYTSTDHEGMHSARAGVVDSTSETYNFDFRFHFNTKQRFQPHVLFGIGVGCLTVHGGSIGLGRQENATYTGLGANLGVGAAFHATDALSMAFDLGYRFQSYESVDGVVDGSLGSSASGSGGFTGFRISYTF